VEEPSLKGCWAKFCWADGHLKALQEKIRSGEDVDLPATTSDFYPQANIHAIRIKVPRYPVLWSVMLGNIVHNLRSALDHLVTQLVIANGRKPRTGMGGNQFPIFSVEPKKGFDASTRGGKLAGVSTPHRAIIQELQPFEYERLHGLPMADYALLVLANLSNIDKHTMLHPTLGKLQTKITEGQLGLTEDLGGIVHAWAAPIETNLHDGAVIASFEFERTRPDAKVAMEVDAEVEVFVEGIMPIIGGCKSMLATIDCILRYFETEMGLPSGQPEDPFYREEWRPD
jgi:hypothetical protein